VYITLLKLKSNIPVKVSRITGKLRPIIFSVEIHKQVILIS
jgi:hypothetical protein